MRAAILAGGRGTRIAGHYPQLPKPMIPLCGKPLLQIQIESLVKQGFTDITLMLGYKADVIKDYFGGGKQLGADITYVAEEHPLGTGGALSLLPKEDTLILFGDVFFDVDFSRFIQFHQEKNADITLFAHPNSHPADSDALLTSSGSRVVAWASKHDKGRGPLRNLVNAGIYLFSAGSMPEGEAERRDLERDVILPRLKDGRVYAYRSTEYVKDMGTPERLKAVESDIKSGVTAARSLKNKQKAIFLDRDGTINVHDGLITKPCQLRLLEGAAQAIRHINRSAYLAVCVTNQPVVARGDVTFKGLDEIHARLDTLLAGEGAYLDDLLFCPHHTDRGFEGEVVQLKLDCDCRKPKPGLLLQAAGRYNIDLSQSYMIGDSWRDIEAGRAAGCTPVKVDGKRTLLHAVKSIIPCADTQ